MQIKGLSTITDQEMDQLVNVWESAVTATHYFLTKEGIQTIKQYVPQAFREVEHLLVAIQDNQIKGLMGINGNKLEMLFIDNSERGHGIGTKLLSLGVDKYHVNELAVNEQNPAA